MLYAAIGPMLQPPQPHSFIPLSRSLARVCWYRDCRTAPCVVLAGGGGGSV